MPEIILTEEQARVFAEAKEPVEIRDAAGTILIKVDPADALALANFRKRSERSGPGVPGGKVLEHLHALQEEWDRRGGFDTAYMREFLNRLRAEDNHAPL